MTDDRRPRGSHQPEQSDTPTGQIRPLRNLTVEVAGRTDKGRVRPGNEDTFALEQPTTARARAQGTLLLVSDGMGGHAAGEVASKLAVETIQAAFYQARGVPVADAVRDAITRANDAIYANAERDPSHSGMGCTIVALVVQAGGLTIGHVGDSRAYLIRNGKAHQLTRDHSWVAMQVAEGILTPEQAEHHPNRSVLIRALGRHATVEVDIGFERLQSGDVLVVCSDGLTGVVEDEEIATYAGRHEPAALAEQLVNLANQRGAPDNVTVVAAAISSGGVPDAATTISTSRPDAATTSILPQVDVATSRGMPTLGNATTTPGNHRPDATETRLGVPAGTPIVVSRSSSPARTPRIGGRPLGRRRLLAGAAAALGLAGALALLTLLVRMDDPAQSAATRPAETPVAAAPSAGGAASAPPAPAATVTVPPPLPTGLPAVAVPGAGSAATPAVVPTAQPTAPASAPSGPSQPAATPTGVAGIVSAIGRGVATQLPTLVASPPALTLPTVAPTATPTPAQRSDAAPEAAPEAGAAAAEEPAPEGADDGASAMTPEAAPEGAEPEAAAPEDPAAEEPVAQDSEPAPAQTPRAQGSRTGPGGITIPNNPWFRPSRKDDD